MLTEKSQKIGIWLIKMVTVDLDQTRHVTAHTYSIRIKMAFLTEIQRA